MSNRGASGTRELPSEVFHVADAANWPSIQRRGLLCTETLLAGSGVTAEDAAAARAHRPQGLQLSDGVQIRDQRPAPPDALARCLDPGVTPADWYGLLNGSIFFWLDRDRVERHTLAQKGRATVLITLDAHRLADRYGAAMFLTPFNIGNARRRAASRGWRTLVPLARWRLDGWTFETAPGRAPRDARAAAAELVIRGDAPDALAFVTRVEPCGA